MKSSYHRLLAISLVIFCLIFQSHVVFADDTCVFMTTADDIPPKIVLLLDNGTSMEQIYWHPDYDNSIDYTPVVVTQSDVVENGTATGNGFFNDNGYGIANIGDETNRQYCLGPILDNLEIDSTNCLQADISSFSGAMQFGTGTWTINGKTLTLPADPYHKAVNGIVDNARAFRYEARECRS